jgi:hypothetical protein
MAHIYDQYIPYVNGKLISEAQSVVFYNVGKLCAISLMRIRQLVRPGPLEFDFETASEAYAEVLRTSNGQRWGTRYRVTEVRYGADAGTGAYQEALLTADGPQEWRDT